MIFCLYYTLSECKRVRKEYVVVHTGNSLILKEFQKFIFWAMSWEANNEAVCNKKKQISPNISSGLSESLLCARLFVGFSCYGPFLSYGMHWISVCITNFLYW